MKYYLLILFVFMCLVINSQENLLTENPKIEVHFNLANLVAFRWLDISYERVLNSNSSTGVSSLIRYAENKNYNDLTHRNYSLTPFYRYYISKKEASGFYLGTFIMFNGGVINKYEKINNVWQDVDKSFNSIAFGFGMGIKLITKRKFIGTINTGLGRNTIGEYSPKYVLDIGVSFGYRF